MRNSDSPHPTWHTRAACRGLTDLFFPEQGEPTTEAKRVCNACPVRTECLTHALDHNERWGVWGGTSHRERRVIRKAPHGTTRDDTTT